MSEQLNLSELSEQELRESYTYDDLATMVSNLQTENQKLYTQLMEVEKEFINSTVSDMEIQKNRIESMAQIISFYKTKSDEYVKKYNDIVSKE